MDLLYGTIPQLRVNIHKFDVVTSFCTNYIMWAPRSVDYLPLFTASLAQRIVDLTPDHYL